jgi:hypothetical protein
VPAQEFFGNLDILIRDGGGVDFGRPLMLMRVLEIGAFQRTIDGLFTLGAAANGADIAVDTGTVPARFADIADDAIHVPSIERAMRTNLYLKVVVEHDEQEAPEKLGAELCRQLERNYIVREAELASVTKVED